MICPHCSVRLPRRERLGHRCARCGRGFVFEPHDHGSRLSDVRVRRAAEWLREDGRYRYTLGQLAAAVSRRGGLRPGFHDLMRWRWPEVYGSHPAGLVDDVDRPTSPTRPAAAHVVCPDRDVFVCLLANDVPERLSVHVGQDDDPPPGRQPVLVLDDPSERSRARLAALRASGRRALAVTPSSGGVRLVQVRPSTLVEWLALAVATEARFRAGARRAAAVDFLKWPAPDA